MSSSNCCFLTCIQVSQEAGQVVWCSHLFQNFPQFIVIHTVKGFCIVNKAEIDVFLELSCFFNDPVDVGNLISDRMWSTGEGNRKPLQYSCLENPINGMKRQKERTLKDELPMLVGTQYTTGDQWRNNYRKNNRRSQSKNNTLLWIWQVMEVKSVAVKSNIA